MYKGIAASRGIGIGKAFVVKEKTDTTVYREKKIPDTEVDNEITRFTKAVEATDIYYDQVAEKSKDVLSESEQQVFQAYKLVLKDPIFKDMVTGSIRDELLCAEGAVIKSVELTKSMFLALNDEYMRQRADDIDNVGKQILISLTGSQSTDLSMLTEDSIIIAEDLTPADTVSMNRKFVKGFAVEKGGETSHTAIIARTMEIPALVGCGDKIRDISHGDTLIIDGQEGILIAKPTPDELKNYLEKQKQYLEELEKIKALKNEPGRTLDGKNVHLVGNIAKPEEAKEVLEKGGDGIGLFRTEFLYLNRKELPSEEDQFKAYKEVAEVMKDRPCIIRTLDIGGDKQSALINMPKEDNPFMGYRAIRICLKEKEMFKTQLRAILRASAYGNLKIMFPMISCLEELRAAKEILNEAKAELDEKNIPYNRDIQVGIMIEIPSAAMAADILAQEADFFSIGTNDLCQYTLAVDRMNENISSLYNPLNIGVLRLIKRVIDCAHEFGIMVGMCGEMASNPEYTSLLLGLGLDEFSMVPASIPHVKQAVRNTTYDDAVNLAEEILSVNESDKIKTILRGKLNAH
ncbi:MAG: phosphoenolpyruvate--protein phosphotransferase [Clostridiaceae bacterium]|nr:phosphoenolpyruvate--protein phosphotransferase [Clostridiaceae bacterium]